MNRPAHASLTAEATAESAWLELIRRHVASLRYGVVQIVVHDGHVTQIEKTERVRLDSRARSATEAA